MTDDVFIPVMCRVDNVAPVVKSFRNMNGFVVHPTGAVLTCASSDTAIWPAMAISPPPVAVMFPIYGVHVGFPGTVMALNETWQPVDVTGEPFVGEQRGEVDDGSDVSVTAGVLSGLPIWLVKITGESCWK